MSVNDKKSIDEALVEQYDKEFDSEWFLQAFYEQLHPAEENTLRKLNDVFTQGKLKGPIKSCVEIGCGPIVHRLSAPSKVCDILVYSDISSNNRKMVQDWINGTENDPRHLNMFKYCAKLEGFDDLEKGAKVIANRIKSKVKSVKPINVLVQNLIGQLDEPFDVAFSAACLESACDSFESYVIAIKNIASIIRPGGYFLLKSYLGNNFYVVNGVEFPALSLSLEMVRKGLSEGGFDVLEIEIIDEGARENIVGGKKQADSTGSLFAVAQKK